VAKAVPAYHRLPAVPGPVNGKGFSQDIFQEHETPETTVITAVPVISQNEKVSFWDCHPAKIIQVLQISLQELILSVDGMGIRGFHPIDLEFLVYDPHRISAYSNHPFDEIFIRLQWVDKNDDIRPAGDFSKNLKPFNGRG
jgi:hypothetical protein